MQEILAGIEKNRPEKKIESEESGEDIFETLAPYFSENEQDDERACAQQEQHVETLERKEK